jgi:hypothetical protein
MTNQNHLPILPADISVVGMIYVLKIVGPSLTDDERSDAGILDYYHEEDRDEAETDAEYVGGEIVRDFIVPERVRVVESTKGLPTYTREHTYTSVSDAIEAAGKRAYELRLSRRVPQTSYTLLVYADCATTIEVLA